MKVPILTSTSTRRGGADYAHHNNTRPSGSSDLPTAMQTVVTYIRDSYNRHDTHSLSNFSKKYENSGLVL